MFRTILTTPPQHTFTSIHRSLFLCVSESTTLNESLCVSFVQLITDYWQAESSSNNKVIRQYMGPKEYKRANVMYVSKSDASIWADFCTEHECLRQWVSRSLFLNNKPFYLRPHKWLTCKCPTCHEIQCMLDTFVRNVPAWHKQALRNGASNRRPPDTSLHDNSTETHCWHCRIHNPLYRNLASPSFTQAVDGATGLDALYELCVCKHAVNFGPESTLECAAENEV